ncbi:glucose-6-phosphatase catalytic subunit 1 [Drosophila elegans]|uniref:glucose-6-phosphatase catalytic subunit 1 n=1 Tax=Drosophila elegans TaxID=30023 RepID=UPI0007E7ED6D|nr:glucose-6-phosphatase catalytic subunit 1 [Drosophila elegans]
MEAFLHLAEESYNLTLNRELFINEWAQERLSFFEPLWRFLSVNLEPNNLFNFFIPLGGIFGQDMLLHLLSAITLVSTLNSFEKWIFQEIRPLWFLREQFANEKLAVKPQVALESHQLSCETSGGLPCAHSMTFTVFVLILSSFFFVHCWDRFVSWRSPLFRCIMYPLIVFVVVCMWLSRLYLATEFLHQCILGSYFGIRALNFFEGNNKYLFSRSRIYMITIVCFLGGLAIAVFLIKMRLEMDPHWSVRQAFKWCPEPTYMRHEASPIFQIVRDLGNLMGLALASPLFKLKMTQSTFWRRCRVLGVLEFVNHGLRLYTPKQYGRLVFFSWEFSRNALHSLVLLKYVTKFY